MTASVSKYPVVRIEWVDAEVDNSWTSPDAIFSTEGIQPCVSIGFLIHKPTKRNPFYSVAATRSEAKDEDVEFVAIQTIPKAWIKKVELLTYETSEFKKPRVPKSDGLRVDVGSGEGQTGKDQG